MLSLGPRLVMCLVTMITPLSCHDSFHGYRDQTILRSPILARHPRDVHRRQRKGSSAEGLGTAVYFNGAGQYLRLRPLTKEGRIEIPRDAFTVQFWAKPEGGQNRFTPIVDLYDECSVDMSSSFWTIGISQPGSVRRDARFVFSLKTEGTESISNVVSHRKYDANIWVHVTATYDGNHMNLYINGAKISLSHEQKGDIYGESSAKCKLILIGGSPMDESFFRGELDELRLWNRALDQSEIVKDMYKQSRALKHNGDCILCETFDNLEQWRVKPSLEPEIIKSDVPLPDHHLRFEAPPCGNTVCDDPAAVNSYVDNEELRHVKTVNYRVVNVAEDDGSNPLVSEKQIFDQHKLLNSAFSPYNISFLVDEVRVKNSNLRAKMVLLQCTPYMIGNGECDADCAHFSLGNDGGDCDQIQSECLAELLGNGVCDAVCNKAYHQYDAGDCCSSEESAQKTCIDPESPYRGYMNIEELKQELRLDNSGHVHIYFLTARWYSRQFRGLSTHPWEKNVYTSMGGIIMHVDSFGHLQRLKNLVHEFGHSFGLWHVHRGISEVRCDSECFEAEPSMVRGDMCSDTNPTPRNRACMDPVIHSYLDTEDTCGLHNFRDTPFNNYMSYADDTCIDHFTPQQVARMHCYLDLVYQPMREMKQPPPVPLAPKVVTADDSSIRLVWLEPLGTDASCDSANAYYQYADVATSSHSGVRWSPSEATGFPDAEQCLQSLHAWMPHYWGEPPTCSDKNCWLELGFKVAVVPKRITVWIADIRQDTQLTVEMVSTEGHFIPGGQLPAYCDMEATLVVRTKKRIKKVRIYTSQTDVAIDAVEMVSLPNFPKCTMRKSPKYKLTRQPPLPEGYAVIAKSSFTDTDVTTGVTYQYKVESFQDGRDSVPSPGLTYTHGEPFCGDGAVTGDEECDDQNSFDGDGCSIVCRLEEGFRCKAGNPSMCYRYKNDGVCEEFERTTGARDCGLYTPDGYIDQWALYAVANPKYQTPDCPATAVTGKPDVFKTCEESPSKKSWWPCREIYDVTGNFWLEVQVYKPVVALTVIIYLDSDGSTDTSADQQYLHVTLLTTRDTFVDLDPSAIPARCEDSPLYIPVYQNLSRPFYLTKGVRISFTISSISIASVGIRSSNFVNPPVLQSCGRTELYNPRSGNCVENTCKPRTCGEFPVKYGNAHCSGNEEGDTCYIRCDKGYRVESHENKATCADGQWVTMSPLVCVPVSCGPALIQHATVNCMEGTTYLKQCHFKCDKPARLTGTDTTLTCGEDGRWSTQNARCIVRCDPLSPDLYQHGELKTPSCAQDVQTIGQQCKIRCSEGYHVDGERNRKRVHRLVCEADGVWDGLDCVPNQCEPLPVIFKGAYTCTDDLYTESTCTMNCYSNLTMFQSVTCTQDGKWDGQLTICPADVQKRCDVIESHDDVVIECMDNTVGGKCSVSCRKPGHVALFRQQTSGPEVVLTEVDKLLCTVMKKWEPAPSRIHCEAKCDTAYIGDEFCDAINNRELCGWDDGDCCESTVNGGVVTSFPEDCGAECKCKDPDAVENRRRKRRHKTRRHKDFILTEGDE